MSRNNWAKLAETQLRIYNKLAAENGNATTFKIDNYKPGYVRLYAIFEVEVKDGRTVYERKVSDYMTSESLYYFAAGMVQGYSNAQ